MDDYGEKHLIQHILDAGCGFVFRSEEGTYLTRYLFWVPHKTPEEAYVHYVATFDCQNWDIQPHEMIPAKDEDGIVTILGEPIPYNNALA